MAKKYLGIDVGYDSVKLALVKKGKVLKTAVETLPVNLMKEGRITSVESMGELLRNSMKKNRINAAQAAVVLSGENTYLRTTTMPQMNAEQLAYNIPYEFNDYITDELKNYVFDYAMLAVTDGKPSAEEEELEEEAGAGGVSAVSGGASMTLLAAAAPVSLLDEYRDSLRKAGLKLAKAAPVECAYINLIRDYQTRTGAGPDQEYCILDLGYQAIRMYMFRGDRHMVTRLLEIGLSSLDDVVADALEVDVHLAHTYILTNYEGVQQKDFCVNAFNNIAVELMRALNFYRFSNPDSTLRDVWLCGGGSMIAALREALASTLDMQIHPGDELIPGGTPGENYLDFVQAVGLALD